MEPRVGNKYRLGRKIGSGSFGEIYLAGSPNIRWFGVEAMGGGDHVEPHGYPKGVWSPTGGWWCDPKFWRRNTALTLLGIFAVCVPIAMKSIQLEQRPVPPTRPIPSQRWCKNFGPPLPEV